MREFRDITAMIIDPRGYSRDLLRGILVSLGVHDIVNLSNTLQGLSALQTYYRDVVFCHVTAGNSADFMKKLRRDVRTRNITVPVFLVSAGAHADQALIARDAGMNGVIVKPVSAATVERKLQATLQTPRDFVASRTFIGPDRRTSREDRRGLNDEPGFEDQCARPSDARVFAVPPALTKY